MPISLPPQRISMLTLGSRGDVQPYIALGLGLQAAGHAVRIATHTHFESFVRSYGLEFAPMEGNPRQLLESEEGQRLLSSGRNPVRIMRRFAELAEPMMNRLLQDGWAASEGAEALLYSIPAFFSYHIAEKMKIFSMPAYFQPVSRTRAFAGIAFPQSKFGPYNVLTHLLTEQIAWQPFRAMINRWRVAELNLPPVPFWGYFSELQAGKMPMLYGYSPTVVPKPSDWGNWLHVTGYWFLDEGQEWEPDQDLVDFLAAGPPPVYIGFGSMQAERAERLTGIVLDSLKAAQCRAVLLKGWGGLAQTDLPPEVFMIDSLPHDWLFPHTAAVVHHGGAGTTAAGLRAGVPSVVLPFFADQAFWGHRVAALGAGPDPLPQKSLTAAELTGALIAATSRVDFSVRAAEIGRGIRAETGVQNAVAAFEEEMLRFG